MINTDEKRIQLPDDAKKILDMLQSSGFEAYVVGGCVRDSLLGIEPKDWDICTSAKPEEVIACMGGLEVIKTGIKHGTVTVLVGKEPYEVTTYRTDGAYSDHRHPDEVFFTTSLFEDLSRRDFTINAMAYNEEEGLVDMFSGRDDLQRGIIRCVGYPDLRFEEDALRVLRALRFSSVYGFVIDGTTSNAIHRNARSLRRIANDRIRDELVKLLAGKNAYEVLMAFSDVICEIIPEIGPCRGFVQNNPYHCYTVYGHIACAVGAYKGDDAAVNMALLLHDIRKPGCYTEDENGGHFKGHAVASAKKAQVILDRLHFDNKTFNNIFELVLYHDAELAATEKSVRRWLNRIGPVQFQRLLAVRNADIAAHAPATWEKNYAVTKQADELFAKILKEQQCFKMKDLKINGRDVIALGVPEGETVGAVLSFLLESVLDGALKNEKEELLRAAKEWIKKMYKENYRKE